MEKDRALAVEMTEWETATIGDGFGDGDLLKRPRRRKGIAPGAGKITVRRGDIW